MADHVATVTLNDPESGNALTGSLCEELARVWARIRDDDDVRAIVIRAAGRDFSVSETDALGTWPKSHRVWKPLVTAVQGEITGGGLDCLAESEIVLCSDTAMLVGVDTGAGAATLEPSALAGLTRRLPLGTILRLTALGVDPRLSARGAMRLGIVSEVVSGDLLWSRADDVARSIARRPPAAVQAGVRAVWDLTGPVRRVTASGRPGAVP
ncbi:enoyl-CoA hydratase/isomerase family protein [Pseudonocardia pini]|uniref:enoyl-CoA hydratase/isomerase family protein n=1 Tax=Pseudonocardia pini TaxID=2758030 RepID=UPI0015F010BB|nr:enoyl-CoA hydratase/isomerase family protein [Pseudonocardia pini]